MARLGKMILAGALICLMLAGCVQPPASKTAQTAGEEALNAIRGFSFLGLDNKPFFQAYPGSEPACGVELCDLTGDGQPELILSWARQHWDMGRCEVFELQNGRFCSIGGYFSAERPESPGTMLIYQTADGQEILYGATTMTAGGLSYEVWNEVRLEDFANRPLAACVTPYMDVGEYSPESYLYSGEKWLDGAPAIETVALGAQACTLYEARAAVQAYREGACLSRMERIVAAQVSYSPYNLYQVNGDYGSEPLDGAAAEKAIADAVCAAWEEYASPPGYLFDAGDVVWPDQEVPFLLARGQENGCVILDGVVTMAYCERDGRVISRLDWIEDLSGGIAVIGGPFNSRYQSRDYGYMDADGKILLPVQAGQRCFAFSGSKGVVQRPDGRFVALDRGMNELETLPYEELIPPDAYYGDDPYYSFLSDGKWGYLDMSFRVTVPARFDGAEPFREGLARVKVGKQWGYIDQSGTWAVEPFMPDTSGDGRRYQFHEGMACVPVGTSTSYQYRFIDREGRFIGDTYPFAHAFSGGFAVVTLEDGSYNYLDRQGGLLLPESVDYAGDFHEGRAAFRVGNPETGKYGFLDQNGEVVIPAIYDKVAYSGFQELVAAVKKGDRWGYIDLMGREASPFIFYHAGNFIDGYANVELYGKLGFLTRWPGPPG